MPLRNYLEAINETSGNYQRRENEQKVASGTIRLVLKHRRCVHDCSHTARASIRIAMFIEHGWRIKARLHSYSWLKNMQESFPEV